MNNIKYYCMMRDLFDDLPVCLVNNYRRENNYLFKIENKKIRKDILNTEKENYSELDFKISQIAKKLFEKGRYKFNIVVEYDDKQNIINTLIDVKGKREIEQNNKIYYKIIRNNKRIIKNNQRKKLLKKILNMNEYKMNTYSKYEINYSMEKYKSDTKEFIKQTKGIYIQNDNMDEITNYYHNYRTIETRLFQLRYIMNVLDNINDVLRKIYNVDEIIKYNGIKIEKLYEYRKQLEDHTISMVKLSNKIMKLE